MLSDIDKVFNIITSSLRKGDQPGPLARIAERCAMPQSDTRKAVQALRKQGRILVYSFPDEHRANEYALPKEQQTVALAAAPPRSLPFMDSDMDSKDALAKTQRIFRHNPWRIPGGLQVVCAIIARAKADGRLPPTLSFFGLKASSRPGLVPSPQCPGCAWPFSPLPGEILCIDCLQEAEGRGPVPR